MGRSKEKKRDLMLWILLSVIAIGTLTFYIWHQARSFQLGIEVSRMEEEIRVLKSEVERLKVEKAGLESLEMVEKTARDKLLLRKARADQIVRGLGSETEGTGGR